MTLQELQAMIKEEFSHFIKEQPGGPAGAPPMPPAPGGNGAIPPPPPGAPGINVAPGDIDAMEPPAGGPEGAEAQLQTIFTMLKSYFEGGEEGMEEPDMDMGMGDEVPDMDMPAPELPGGEAPEDDGGDIVEPTDVEVDDDEEEEPTVDEAYGEKTGGNAASTSGKYGGTYGASGEDKGNAQLHEGFKSRMQKLANIRK